MGLGFSSTWYQFFPPKPKFSTNDIPDLTGKVVIVTGSTSGIGLETVKQLLLKNANVYLAARSKEKADAAIKMLKAEVGREPKILHLDLANIAAIRKSAAEFKTKESELHILFNNGGVMRSPMDMLTSDGYDLQFGTNVLGHYVFTTELLPLLKAGAQTSSDKKSRIVNVSSYGSELTDKIVWDTLIDSPTRNKSNTSDLYSQSKFGNVVLSNEFAKRYADAGIVSTSLNPGNIRTDLGRYMGKVAIFLVGFLVYPVPKGALTSLYAGTSPETVDMNGKYFIPWARVGTMNPAAQDSELGAKLWTWLEEQTRKH